MADIIQNIVSNNSPLVKGEQKGKYNG
jgi:hypothetical protein